jgi:hypothetical protein
MTFAPNLNAPGQDRSWNNGESVIKLRRLAPARFTMSGHRVGSDVIRSGVVGDVAHVLYPIYC